jgi:photosystem II stability/assembly factor-like uncharacterized protein
LIRTSLFSFRVFLPYLRSGQHPSAIGLLSSEEVCTMVMLYVATDVGLAVVSQGDVRQGNEWRADRALPGKNAQCVAVDPRHPEHVYCGTFDAGLWRSHDAGRSWERVGVGGIDGILHPSVMALAVSSVGTVWAGTEPSAIFSSENGAESWQERQGLRDLPSASTWSFPPRPYTSHVRWIQLDPNDPQCVLASIEAGGVMRSEDGGATWHDRQPDTPRDAHGLAMDFRAPGRVHVASGDAAYAESLDGGRTWRRHNDGLGYYYLWSVAVDPGDPETVIVSASPSAFHAHNANRAESAIFRRQGDGDWEQVSRGLPPAAGTMTYTLTTAAGALYAAPHEGDLYRSEDGGRTWDALHVRWFDTGESSRQPYVHALLAVA